jgi:hypothetical protein
MKRQKSFQELAMHGQKCWCPYKREQSFNFLGTHFLHYYVRDIRLRSMTVYFTESVGNADRLQVSRQIWTMLTFQ